MSCYRKSLNLLSENTSNVRWPYKVVVRKRTKRTCDLHIQMRLFCSRGIVSFMCHVLPSILASCFHLFLCSSLFCPDAGSLCLLSPHATPDLRVLPFAACYTDCVCCVPSSPRLLSSHFTAFTFHSAFGQGVLERLNVSVSMPAHPACNVHHWQAHGRSTLRHRVNNVSLSTRCIDLHLLDIRSKVSTLQKNTRTVQRWKAHKQHSCPSTLAEIGEKRVKQEGKFSHGACWSPTFSLASTGRFLACFWPCIWATMLTEEPGQISISYRREQGPITCSQPAIKRLDELLTSCKKLWRPFL